MLRPRHQWTALALAGLTLLLLGIEVAAREPNAGLDVILRYGISGYIQPIGLHHGFHIEDVAPGSAATQDRLQPHDVIVKVDGESIRSLEHFRTLLTDAYEGDGTVLLTVMKDRSLEHHVIKGDVKGRRELPPAQRARPADPEDDDRS
jgi:S1-C subfamily serine protease